jgi:hypothetical protein
MTSQNQQQQELSENQEKIFNTMPNYETKIANYSIHNLVRSQNGYLMQRKYSQ